MEETNRQRKIAGVLQKDLVDVLQKAAQDGMKGVIISVSKVFVTSDLGVAKVYFLVCPVGVPVLKSKAPAHVGLSVATQIAYWLEQA